MNKNIHIFALAAEGKGISGGDRIFIEFARHWSKGNSVTIYLSGEGYQMCQRQHLETSHVKFLISRMNLWRKLGFTFNYFAKILEGIRFGLGLKLKDSADTIIYSASEFWMDSLPALILKLRYPNVKWVAAWYQTAPNPLQGFTEGERQRKYRLSSLLYFLVQFPIRPLINNFASFVLVNNNKEKKVFPNLNKKNKVLVVLGAINLSEINEWKRKLSNLPKVYDGVFQGRFHPQKGVMELLDIWQKVVKVKQDTKLVLIGDGPLMEKVKLQIAALNLGKNVILLGYLFDGRKKYETFAQSRITLHPSFFDSGGMASLEAMAFGLPAVGFNLNSYKYYYPKGMIKVKIGNLAEFAQQVSRLLQDKELYKKMSQEALSLIDDKLSWQYRARQILETVLQ